MAEEARGRVHRLIALFGMNPQVLGIGIDQNTAIEVTSGKRFTVLGEGAVMVFDKRVSHPIAADAGHEEVLALTDPTLQVLPDRYGLDLETLRPLLPDGTVLPKE